MIRRKVVYMFTPRIVPDDGGSDCIGTERTITDLGTSENTGIPRNYHDYNGFNISCYGKSDGYIRIEPSPEFGSIHFQVERTRMVSALQQRISPDYLPGNIQ